MKKINISLLLKTKLLIIFMILIFSPTNILAGEAHLWFKTVFDGLKVYGTPPVTTDPDKYDVRPNLMGKDRVTGYRFPEDLPGMHWTDDWLNDPHKPLYNQFRTNIYPKYNKYLPVLIDISVKKVDDGPFGKPAYVLHQETKLKPASVPREAYQLTGLTTSNGLHPINDSTDPKMNMNTIYKRYYTRHHFIANNPYTWRQVDQTKYNDNGTLRFKWTVFMYDFTHEGKWKWMLKLTEVNYPEPNHAVTNDVWVQQTDIPVPKDEWFKYEIYVKISTGDDGIIVVAVNDKVVLERRGWNQKKAAWPKQGHRLTGVYGAYGYQETTNLELWDKPPADSVLSKYVEESDSQSTSNSIPIDKAQDESTDSENSDKFIMKKGILE